MIKEIILLGNEGLYEVSNDIEREELYEIKNIIEDLHDTLVDFRNKYKIGRAIAAPQIGVKKRLLYMYIDYPIVFINPRIVFNDNEKIKVLDDCMSFPTFLVMVERYKRCTIKYKDIEWNDCEMKLEGDLSELLQHEYDHLNGVLSTMRAIDDKSFYIK